jgi:hypothetical protein
MDPSEANLVLWVEPTSLLRSGLFAALFPWMTEALWLVWPSWVGAVGLGGATGPGWCGRPCLLALVHCFYGSFD